MYLPSFAEIPLRSFNPYRRVFWLCLGLLGVFGSTSAANLSIQPAATSCGVVTAARPTPPLAVQQRLPDSQAVSGQQNIAWVWLASPSARYGHAALGSPLHAGSLHALVKTAEGKSLELVYRLPMHQVFEDRVPRLVDLDGDGRDEVVVVESDQRLGAAIVVFAVRGVLQPGASGKNTTPIELVEVARSAAMGSAYRWLNPVGFADFDGDGQLDLASVSTPHIGGVLTLYHFRPPHLLPFATALDVSNHRNGTLEQQLAVIIEPTGQRPVIVIADMQLQNLQALQWDGSNQLAALGAAQKLQASVQRMTPADGGACLQLTDGSSQQARLPPK
jgi:hypothetical protein